MFPRKFNEQAPSNFKMIDYEDLVVILSIFRMVFVYYCHLDKCQSNLIHVNVDENKVPHNERYSQLSTY